MKVFMKCVNIKLWDILGCFHYILNAPRIIFTDSFDTDQARDSIAIENVGPDLDSYYLKLLWFS